MKSSNIILLIALAVAVASPAQAQRGRKAGPPADGTMLSQSCMSCHGYNGASTAGPMPTIGGQSEVYISNAMKAFRDGSRPSTVMGRLAKAYSDPEIAAISKYFSDKPFVRRDQKIPSASADAGRRSYEKTCKRCHLNNGRESSEPDYPILAGQWLETMQIAIEDIKADRRKVDEKFRAKLDELTPAETDAVLHFFASQK